jgi:uncharacterized protein (DUF1800 family)
MNAIAIAANRFGLGIRPNASIADKASLLKQIDQFDPMPAAIAALPKRAELIRSLQDLRTLGKEKRELKKEGVGGDAAEMAQEQLSDYRKSVRGQYAGAVAARLQIAATSNADFAERLVHFWSNHFAVSIDKIAIVGLAGNYEFDAIRPHIFGKFGDLLNAAVHHPAMLLYLDQAQSIGPNSMLATRVNARRDKDIGLNENLAREILELHTLGVRTVYTQQDVTEFARALTGRTVSGLAPAPMRRFIDGTTTPGESVFVEAVHQPGTRKVIGRTYAASGEAQAKAILSDLATHPATAKHIATKLARHFVADNPPSTLVAKLEANYLKTGGDLSSLYRTLIAAPESWAAGQPKFKSPWEWTVSAMRALNVAQIPGNPQAAAGLFTQLGQQIWKPGAPAGFADTAKEWAGPAGLMRRVETASRLARQNASQIDARKLAPAILPDVLSMHTAEQIARAESPEQGLALLLVAPEFLRR